MQIFLFFAFPCSVNMSEPEGTSGRSQSSQFAGVVENPNLSRNKHHGAGLEELIHVEESAGVRGGIQEKTISPPTAAGRKMVTFLYDCVHNITDI